MRVTVVGCLACVLLTAVLAPAATYQYYPEGAMTLGGSFNPLYPNRAYPACLEFQTSDRSIDHGAPATQFTASEVKSRKELYHQLHIDANLSASGFFGSGSASFNLDEKYQFESDDDYFTLRAYSDYGRFMITNAHLTPEAEALRKNPRAFGERCGTEFVEQERRVAQLVAVYSFQHLSDYQEKRVQAALNASFSGVTLGGHYDETNKSTTEQMHLSVDIYAIGGGGIKLLASVATTAGLDKLRSILETYISQLGPDQAAPMEFVTGSWESFGVDVPLEPMEIRNAVLPELYFSYRENEVNFHKLGDLIRSASRPQSTIKPDDITKYQNDYLQISLVMRDLMATAKACLQNVDLCTPTQAPRIYKVDWPQAVFQTIWADTDENGNPYMVQFSVRTVNLHYAADKTTQGSFTLPLPNSQITTIDYICNDSKCGWSYARAGGYAADYQKSADSKSFTWYRVWDGDPHDETYIVHYQVQRAVCVENCNYVLNMLTANGQRTKAVPNWNWSSAQRRALVRKAPQQQQPKGSEAPKQ